MMDSLDTNPTGRCIQIVCWIQSEALKGDVFPTRQAFGSMITRNKSSIYVIDLRWSWELIKWWVFCLWTLELLWWNKELITKAWRTETRNCSTASLKRFDRWALFLCHHKPLPSFFWVWSQTWQWSCLFHFFSSPGTRQNLPSKMRLISDWISSKNHAISFSAFYHKVSSSIGKIFTKAVLVHDPVSSFSPGSSPQIENKSFPQPEHTRFAAYLFVFPSGLPVPRNCSSVGAGTIWVFAVVWVKEEPFHISSRKKRFIWKWRINTHWKQRMQSSVLICLVIAESKLPGSSHGSNLHKSITGITSSSILSPFTFLFR